MDYAAWLTQEGLPNLPAEVLVTRDDLTTRAQRVWLYRFLDYEAIWEPNNGEGIEVCKACGAVHEGTAAATLDHFEQCSAVATYYTLRNKLGVLGNQKLSADEAWDVVCRTIATPVRRP